MSLNGRRTVVLGLVLVGLTTYGLTRLWGGPESAAAQGPPQELPAEPGEQPPLIAPPILSEDDRREQQAIAAAAWPPDPFHVSADIQLHTPQAAETEDRSPGEVALLTLSGVISGPSPLAMINGRVVRVGDQVARGVVVTAIEADSVRLETPVGQYTLRLAE